MDPVGKRAEEERVVGGRRMVASTLDWDRKSSGFRELEETLS